MGIWVGERAETVVILLAGRIPKSQLDVLSIDLNIGHIVLEDGWDVDLSSHIISLARYSCYLADHAAVCLQSFCSCLR